MNSPIRIAIGRLQYKCAAVGSTQAGEDGEAHIIHISKSFLVENGAVEDASGVGGGRHDDEDCWIFACCNTIIYLLFAKVLHSATIDNRPFNSSSSSSSLVLFWLLVVARRTILPHSLDS